MDILLVIIALSLLILVHELGHFLAAKAFGLKVLEFGLGFPPKVFSKKFGETEYSFNLLPFGGFVKIHGEQAEKLEDIEDKERSLAFQPTWKKSCVILAGVLMNVILGWILISGVFMVGAPEHLSIASVSEESPAAVAGLQSGDIITEVTRDGTTLQDPIKSDKFVEFIDEDPGAEYMLTIQRGEETFEREIQGRADPPAGEGNIGVSIVDIGYPQKSFFGSLYEGIKSTSQMLWLITVSFFTLIVKIFSEPEVMESITGPVGIFVMAKQTGALGMVYLMQLTALISLNLAVLNLIPFPALDGGRFIMALAEKVKGSPIPRKVELIANGVGLILLLILMIVVTVQDVGRFIL